MNKLHDVLLRHVASLIYRIVRINQLRVSLAIYTK